MLGSQLWPSYERLVDLFRNQMYVAVSIKTSITPVTTYTAHSWDVVTPGQFAYCSLVNASGVNAHASSNEMPSFIRSLSHTKQKHYVSIVLMLGWDGGI